MSAECCEGGAVEEEETLGGSARCGATGGSASSGRSSFLVMAEQGDLIVCQTELRIGYRIGW
jgi:hypothetical protein